MLISVIICTYRRPDRIELALKSLERQTYNSSDWEVLVVENDFASALAMNAIIDQYKESLPLRHVLEPNVGLSNARNTGARLANGEYLAYLDDDAEAVDYWLSSLIEVCRSKKPHFCGGPSLPLYLSAKPAWFLDAYATSYMYGNQARFLKTGEWLGGMNFIVSKKIYGELGGFRTDLGMNGNNIGYGEETDLMIRAWKNNPQLKVLYIPNIVVRHEVRPEKMILRWNLIAAWALGRSASTVFPINRKKALIGFMRVFKNIAFKVLMIVPWLFRRKKNKYYLQQWLYEEFRALFHGFAYNLYSLFR